MWEYLWLWLSFRRFLNEDAAAGAVVEGAVVVNHAVGFYPIFIS
jgi:hypothetical protein